MSGYIPSDSEVFDVLPYVVEEAKHYPKVIVLSKAESSIDLYIQKRLKYQNRQKYKSIYVTNIELRKQKEREKRELKRKEKLREYWKRMSETPSSKEMERRQKISVARAYQLFPYKDTSIELIVQAGLTKLNIRYDKHKVINGLLPSPYKHHQFDIVIIEKKMIIEVDGCYWHGCPLHCPNNLESQRKAVVRDKAIIDFIKTTEWALVRLWEHDINSGVTIEYLLKEKIPSLFSERISI